MSQISNTHIVQNKGTIVDIPATANINPPMTMTMFLSLIFLTTFMTSSSTSSSSSSDLRPGFYSETCPKAENIVRGVMKKALLREPRSVASVMRFQFHDCFVNVCYPSLLSSKFNLFLPNLNFTFQFSELYLFSF